MKIAFVVGHKSASAADEGTQSAYAQSPKKTTRLPPEGVGVTGFFLELHMDDGNGRHGRGINHHGGSPR